jgi:hypothetical protein
MIYDDIQYAAWRRWETSSDDIHGLHGTDWLFIYLHYIRRLLFRYCIFCFERVGRRYRGLDLNRDVGGAPVDADSIVVLSLSER